MSVKVNFEHPVRPIFKEYAPGCGAKWTRTFKDEAEYTAQCFGENAPACVCTCCGVRQNVHFGTGTVLPLW